jgi:hypothetical protein
MTLQPGVLPPPPPLPKPKRQWRFALLLGLAGLVLGGGVGFFLGLNATQAGKKFIENMVSEETDADVGKPQKIDRAAFTVQYPANWKVATTAQNYDPDHMFKIESPGSTHAMFMLDQSSVEPEMAVEKQVAAFNKLMSRPATTRFTQFGSHTGHGAVVKGTILSIAQTIRVFAFSEHGMTGIIIFQYPDEDEPMVRPGMDLIERSFEIKSQETQP